MQYDPQCEQFLHQASRSLPPSATTTTQKLVSLLKSDVAPLLQNAMTFLTSATFQPANKDAVRAEGLIPVFIEQLKSTVAAVQKSASFAVMSVANYEPNRTPFREAGGIPAIVQVLQQVPFPPPEPEVVSNLITALALLAADEACREIMGEVANLRVLLDYVGPRANPTYVDKVLSTVFNLSVGKNNKDTIREAGGIPIVIKAMANEAQRETATKILFNLTGIEANREDIRKEGALRHLVAQLSLPLPAKESAVMVALRTLSNLAVDPKTGEYMTKDNLYGPLVKALGLSSQTCVNQALVCLQNLVNDEASIDSMAQNGALEQVIQLGKTQPSLFQRIAVVFAQLSSTEEVQSRYGDAGCVDFINTLLAVNDLEVQRYTARAVGNSTVYFDEVRSLYGEPVIKRLIQNLSTTDRELIRQSVRALTNLSLNAKNAEIIFASGVNTPILQLLATQDKELIILASKVLVNLTRVDKLLVPVSEKGAIAEALKLLMKPDQELQLQGAKLFTNLATSGRNRKVMHEKGVVAQVKKMVLASDAVKSQFEIAQNNLSFPYEESYDDLDFKLDDKMDIPAETGEYTGEDEEDEEDESEKAARIAEEKERLEKEKREIEAQRLEMERKHKKAEEDRIKAEQVRKTEAAKKKALEDERIKKKKQEEDERLRKKQQEEEERQRIRAEEEKALLEARRVVEELEAAAKAEEEARAKRKQEKREQREREKEEERKREEEEKKRKVEEEAAAAALAESLKATKVTTPRDKTTTTTEAKTEEEKEREKREKAERKEERKLQKEAKAKAKEEKARLKEEKTKKKAEKVQRRAEKAKRKEEKEKTRAEKEARRLEKQQSKQIKLEQQEQLRLKRVAEDRERTEREEKEEKERKEKEEAEEKARRAAEEKEEAERKERVEREEKEKKAREEAEVAALRKLEEEVRKKEEEVRLEEDKKKQEGADKEEKELAAKAQKRTKVAQEILSVERSYCKNLNIIISKFLHPLNSAAASKKPILVGDKVKNIFGIIEVIFNYNSILLDGLEARMKRWVLDLSSPLIIGDIFVRMTDYMTCYSTYINNYNTAMDTIAEAKKTNPVFVQFLRKTESSPECRCQDLEAFLINPIQQLPRYIMLLTDLLRNTTKDHPDFESLTLALKKMKNLTEYVNEQKRTAETVAAIVSIQNRVRGKFPTLLTPHRKFVKEGILGFDTHAHSGGSSVKEKEGYVFLFNDSILLTKSVGKPNEYKYKDQIGLKGMKLEDHKDDQKLKNGFILQGTVKNIILAAKTPQEKTQWIDAIKPHIV